VTGVVGGLVFILALLGYNPSTGLVGGLIIFVFCFVIASYLAYRDLFIQAEKAKNTILRAPILNPKTRLSFSHRNAIWDVACLMDKEHGHDDREGLEADVRDGVLVTDLMSRNCTICGKPRNKYIGRAD
jgi:hypothetical protein